MKLLLIAAALCAGCSTTPPQNPTAATHVYDVPAAVSTAPARVQVIRDTGWIAGAISVHLSLDGVKIASLNPGESFEFAVDPGPHQLSAAGTDPLAMRMPNVLEITFAPSQRATFRIGYDGNFAMQFYRDMATR